MTVNFMSCLLYHGFKMVPSSAVCAPGSKNPKRSREGSGKAGSGGASRTDPTVSASWSGAHCPLGSMRHQTTGWAEGDSQLWSPSDSCSQGRGGRKVQPFPKQHS